MREELKFWIEFLTDKRFNWQFKIANLIFKDDLRSILVVEHLCIKQMSEEDSYGCVDWRKRQLKEVANNLEGLMCK